MAQDNKKIEDLLLQKKEIEKNIQESQFKLAEINQKQAAIPKEKKLETDFDKLSFTTDGINYIDTDVYSRNAVYEYFNENTGQTTLFNGLQAESSFGMNDDDRIKFGKKELGPMYQGYKYLLKFKHYEIN